MAQQVKNLTSILGDVGLIPGVSQLVKDLVLLWLWSATNPTPSLETAICHSCGPKKKKKKKKKKRQ